MSYIADLSTGWADERASIADSVCSDINDQFLPLTGTGVAMAKDFQSDTILRTTFVLCSKERMKTIII